MREKKKGVYQKYLKNLLDRLLALVGTAALSWLLLGVGIAVRLDSGTGAVPAEAGGPERAVFLHIQVPHDAYRHAA